MSTASVDNPAARTPVGGVGAGGAEVGDRNIQVEDAQRLGLLMDMLRSVSTATTSAEAFLAFISRFWQIKPVEYFLGVNLEGVPSGSYQLTYRIPVSVLAAGDFSRARDLRPRNLATLPICDGGLIGSLIRGGRPRLLTRPELAADELIRSCAQAGSVGGVAGVGGWGCGVAIPIFAQGRVNEWALAFATEPGALTPVDLEQALVTANLLATHNDHLDLIHQVRRLNGRLRVQMEEVMNIQASLLPRRTPSIPGLRLATSYLTSDEVGGDYYDFFRVDEERWGILIADVSGHGAGAATVMAMLRTMLHAHADLAHGAAGPGRVLEYANERLMGAGMDGQFVTAFFGVYEPSTRVLTWARAGHPMPRIKHARGVDALTGPAAPPLGILAEYRVPEQATSLEPGQTLVMYTDGITEAFNDRREMFGEDRLDRVLARCPAEPDGVVDTVHAALFDHTGRRTRSDDQTLVVIKVEDEA